MKTEYNIVSFKAFYNNGKSYEYTRGIITEGKIGMSDIYKVAQRSIPLLKVVLYHPPMKMTESNFKDFFKLEEADKGD